MSTRRRASGSSTTVEDGLTLPRYSHSESEDEEGDARTPDGELRDPEQFESLEGHGHAAANGDSWDKSRRVKSGREKFFRIYVMHLLFMWNSRTYEFASIVLVSLAFPGSLAPASIRGIASTVPAVFFASVIGNWIDCSKSRVPPLLTSVYLSHGAVTLSYIAWLLWPVLPTGSGEETPDAQAWNLSKALLFGFIISMDIIHDLSAIANRVSLERDWVPVLVGPITPEVTYGLTQVNAVMKRLDLISKLVAPSILPLIISIFNFREGWILLLAVTAVIFLAIQLRYVHLIARGNPELQALKKPSTGIATDEDCTVEDQYDHLSSGIRSWRYKTYLALYKDPLARLRHYFSMPVWPASIAEAFSQMTVLAYSSTLITYLFEVGFSLTVVTIARGSGTVMALASTFIGPIAVNFVRRRKIRQSPSRNAAGDDIEGAVVRTVGIWGILSQVLCMIPAVLVLWNLSPIPGYTTLTGTKSRDDSTDPTSTLNSPNLILALILFTFLSLSRVGHLIFELMVQEIAQVEIPSSQRSTFAGTEQSFRSMFELFHWGATMVWSRPEDFRFLALGSLLALGSCATIFAAWMKGPRASVKGGYEEVPLDELDACGD